MNIIIMPRVYEYHYYTPRVYLSAAMKRSTSILAYFPTSSKRARGAVRLHDCKWCFCLDHLTDAPWYDNLFLGTLTAESMRGPVSAIEEQVDGTDVMVNFKWLK